MNDKTAPITPTVWHYTTGGQLFKIVVNGCLRPRGLTGPLQKKQILYFSRNQVWEPAQSPEIADPNGHTRLLTMDEANQLQHGLLRFGMDPKRLHGSWIFSVVGSLRPGMWMPQSRGLPPCSPPCWRSTNRASRPRISLTRKRGYTHELS